jgi:hypothetical protein
MSLKFLSQQEAYVIGSAATPATLTASFDDNVEVIHVANKSQVEIYVEYTVNGASSNRTLSLQLEGSPDATTYYKMISNSISSGTETWYIRTGQFVGATGGVVYRFRISEPIADQSLRISVKESGSGDFGTVKVRIIKSG